MSCRCAELRAVFGAGAPARCGACALEARRLGLLAEGLVQVPSSHYQAYRDCGLDPATIEDHTMWVPCWAHCIVAALLGTDACGPVLTRAVFDAEFRDAVMDELSAGVAEADAVANVRALAAAQGVLI